MAREHASSQTSGSRTVGAAAEPDRATLEIHVAQSKQLFNAMDAAPFRERDLDPNAEAFIVGWAEETFPGQPLGLIVRLGRRSATPDDVCMLRDAVHEHFRQRASATRRQLRRLFRVGRISLLIGVAFVAAAIVFGEFVAGLMSKESYGSIVKESFAIGGWVALWRPMQIFLYDWWPIRAEARLHDRLSEMDVRVVDAGTMPAGPTAQFAH